jgi:hypothetical protein
LPTSSSRLRIGTKIERGIVKCRSQLFLLAKHCPDYLGGADRLRPDRSEGHLFRNGKGVIDLNAEIPDGALPRDNQGETAASIRMRMRRGWADGGRA